jgi:DNA repair exonuclease SbcCD ATPase subunit
MATATKAQTKPGGVHELLDVLDQDAKRLGRTAQALIDERNGLGARKPANVSDVIPMLKAERAAILADAMRKGVKADTAAIDAKLRAAEERIEAVGEQLAACRTAQAEVTRERAECLRSHRAELDDLAQQATDELVASQRITREAAVAELEAVRRQRAAVGLGAAALPLTERPAGGTTGFADDLAAPGIADRDNRVAYAASFATGTPERLAAVEIIARAV